jgi:5-methylcytosine-specific restriction endonuclease McrA
LKNVADKLGRDNLTGREYDEFGKFSSATIASRFGKWNNALEIAGLKITFNANISEKDLFANLQEVWIKLGHQPQRRDMKQPLSKYSERGYVTKFELWRKALETFVEFINSTSEEEGSVEEENIEVANKPQIEFKHKTKRQPSERLKVQVLMRDGNKCKLCGITVTGDNIHFDHIKPWSKGGETVLENLQVLCETHNHAKGNLDNEPQ